MRATRALTAAAASAASASASASAPAGSLPPLPPLVREVMHASLYAPRCGYFNAAPRLATPASPLAPAAMLGAGAWRAAVAALYASSPGGWATPSELFAPHHAVIITRYMLLQAAAAAAASPLVIYEVGGGSGAHACSALDWLAAAAPRAYARASYTILEVSQRLQAAQTAALAARGHAHVARSLLADAACLPPAVADDRPCFVLALEVLDNLPHDKVVRVAGGGWRETRVGAGGAEELHAVTDGAVAALLPEVERCRAAWLAAVRAQWPPARLLRRALGRLPPPGAAHAALVRNVAGGGSASLLRECLAAAAFPPAPVARAPPPLQLSAADGAVEYARYVPTGALRMLRELRRALPAHRLIASDFSALPPPRVGAATAAGEASVAAYQPAAGAPLVAGRAADGTPHDYPCYLSAPAGAADILFPTDFVLLARLAADVDAAAAAAAARAPAPRPPTVVHSAEFLRRYAAAEDLAATTTRNGFNPMLEDWPNVRFLLT